MYYRVQLQAKVEEILMNLTPEIIDYVMGYPFILNALSVSNWYHLWLLPWH